MAMRETAGSMRAYFLVAGAAGFVNAFFGVKKLVTSEYFSVLPMSWTVSLVASEVAHLLLGAAFVWAGARLKAELPLGAERIRKILLAAIAVLIGEAIVFGAVFGNPELRNSVYWAMVGLAISIYLLVNLRRLVQAAMANSPPPARVA